MNDSPVNNLLKRLQKGPIQENTKGKGMLREEVQNTVVMSKHELSPSLTTANEDNTTAALTLAGTHTTQSLHFLSYKKI